MVLSMQKANGFGNVVVFKAIGPTVDSRSFVSSWNFGIEFHTLLRPVVLATSSGMKRDHGVIAVGYRTVLVCSQQRAYRPVILAQKTVVVPQTLFIDRVVHIRVLHQRLVSPFPRLVHARYCAMTVSMVLSFRRPW